ncbi:MAG: hypothetical protein K2X99_01345 [Gemmatimonadaceae bacterium]|nr:hypothetical protein [Gemmatimonadaceae bacterium]
MRVPRILLLLALPAALLAQGGRLRALASARDTSWWLPIASIALPGSGQAILRQDRFLGYVAVEAIAAIAFTTQRGEARREQRRYQQIASDVARSPFTAGFRPVGEWAYYEAMEHFAESGVFDRFPGGNVDPEEDVQTFNGGIWRLARETYWRDPSVAPAENSAEYRRAMNLYVARAVRPEYRWSWRNAQLEQDLFRRSIVASNASYRGARDYLGVLIANHLLSAVDAFVTLRLSGRAGARDYRATVQLPVRVP